MLGGVASQTPFIGGKQTFDDSLLRALEASEGVTVKKIVLSRYPMKM